MTNWNEETMTQHIDNLFDTWKEYYNDITRNKCNIKITKIVIDDIKAEIKICDEDQKDYLTERQQGLENRVVRDNALLSKVSMEYKLWFRKLDPTDLKIVVAKANEFNKLNNLYPSLN